MQLLKKFLPLLLFPVVGTTAVVLTACNSTNPYSNLKTYGDVTFSKNNSSLANIAKNHINQTTGEIIFDSVDSFNSMASRYLSENTSAYWEIIHALSLSDAISAGTYSISGWNANQTSSTPIYSFSGTGITSTYFKITYKDDKGTSVDYEIKSLTTSLVLLDSGNKCYHYQLKYYENSNEKIFLDWQIYTFGSWYIKG